MAKSKVPFGDLSVLPITTAYPTPGDFWARSHRADWMVALLQHAFDLGCVVLVRPEQLRRFACWCARSVVRHNSSPECKSALESAENFLAGRVTREQLERAWAASHIGGAPSTIGMQGLVFGSVGAAANWACTESANPNPLAAAQRTAYYAVLATMWERIKHSQDQCQTEEGVITIHFPFWERLKHCDDDFQKPTSEDLWAVLDSDYYGNQNLTTAAEHQVRSEILAAQAEQLRQLVPNPFGELTWKRFILATEIDLDGDNGDSNEEHEDETPSRDRSWVWGRGWGIAIGDRIVYGEVEKELVFIPVNKAERLVRIYAAMEAARTWGEFIRALPAGVYSEIAHAMIENGRGFEEFYLCWIEDHPDGTRDQAFGEYQRLPFGERLPNQNDAFDSANIPGLCDGDWPDWPQQEMLNWVPAVIQKVYGHRLDSVFNGPFLAFVPEDEMAIVETFAVLGYRCERDDCFVNRACGRKG